MARALTFEELMQYAREHYSTGGDGVYECWDKRTYDDYVRECGAITKRKALQIFRDHKAVMDDMQGWY